MKLFKKHIYHPIKNFIAKYYLILLRQFTEIKVIGITGSAGKTTTKEMLASILKMDGPTVFSHANIDPVYNIASTILRCNFSTKYLILEMGIEYPKEMDFYLSLATPDIGVITNIFPTHTLYLKNIDGVLAEKSKLVKKTKIVVLNKNDKKLFELGKILKNNVVWYEGLGDPEKQATEAAMVISKVLGINNLLISRGISNYSKPPHRLNLIKHESGAFILDDSYNSNPEAVIATLKYFGKIAGKNRKIAVLGDMLELGGLEKKEHLHIKNELAKYGFDKVFSVGKISKLISKSNYNSAIEVYEDLLPLLKPKTYVLIKGSRSIGLDKLVDRLVY
jgi:UDP-N-acetylmuramoyl-tripeptide--D-alanyl-D-alanine ligase